MAIYREYGFSVEVNRPFAGTIVPEPFFQVSATVLSVMVEINRSLYMVEESGVRRPDFSAFAKVMQDALRQLIAEAVSVLQKGRA